MFVDLIGLILTVLFINFNYWYILLLLTFAGVIFEFLLFTTLNMKIIKVSAGGIFSEIVLNNSVYNLNWVIPVIFIVLGLFFMDRKDIDVIKILDPSAKYNKPVPVLLIKYGLARILIILLMNR